MLRPLHRSLKQTHIQDSARYSSALYPVAPPFNASCRRPAKTLNTRADCPPCMRLKQMQSTNERLGTDEKTDQSGKSVVCKISRSNSIPMIISMLHTFFPRFFRTLFPYLICNPYHLLVYYGILIIMTAQSVSNSTIGRTMAKS